MSASWLAEPARGGNQSEAADAMEGVEEGSSSAAHNTSLAPGQRSSPDPTVLHQPLPTRPGDAPSGGSSLAKGGASPVLGASVGIGTSGISGSSSASSSLKTGQHRHSRSRSVNLPSFTSPSNGSSTRDPASSPPTTFHPSPPSTASPSSPSLVQHRPASHDAQQPQRSYSRSPELRRPAHFPHDRSLLMPGSLEGPHHASSTSGELASNRSRNASPARMYALPASPRLQAFGSNRSRRPSGSSIGNHSAIADPLTGVNHHGSSPPFPHHRGPSPGPLPASPRSMALPLPVNPDPDHPFDSVWPTSNTPSPSSSPRGRDLGSLHHWMLGREGSHSPILRPTARVGSPVGIPPTSRHLRAPGSGSSPVAIKGSHFNKGHARSLSGSSAGSHSNSKVPNHVPSLSSASSASSSSSSPVPSPSSSPAHDTPLAQLLAKAVEEDRPDESRPAQQTESTVADDRQGGEPSGSSSPKASSPSLLSPATSSVKIDAQHAHAHAKTGSSDAKEDALGQEESATPEPRKAHRPPQLQLRGLSGADTESNDVSVSMDGSSSASRSFFAASVHKSPASPMSPGQQQNALGESPPKTRSFIGMPPRSGYDLSDDPDDVGSEDGASVSSGKDSASTIDEDDRYMDDHEEGDESVRSGDGGDTDERDERREGDFDDAGTFVADEEDEQSDKRRLEAGQDKRQSKQEDDLRHDEVSANGDAGHLSSSRPTLPKRPSLTRNSGVPPPSQHMANSPMRYFDEEASGLRESVAGDNAGSDSPTQGGLVEVDGNDALLADVAIPSSPDLEGPDANEQPNAAAASAAVAAEMEQPEESLSTLERIFLFAKSEMAYHRVIVSRSLPSWIREVELSEAVEYVVALLNGLATDEADVCAAFAMELHHIMWHFYQNCPLVELERDSSKDNGDQEGDTKNETERAIRPRIPVGIFTPLVCALLLNQHAHVANTAQNSLVSFCRRLRGLPPLPDESSLSAQDGGLECLVTHAEGREGEQVEYETYDFDSAAKAAVLAELLDHVAFAMGSPSPERSAADAHSDAQHQAQGQEGEDNQSGQYIVSGQDPGKAEHRDDDLSGTGRDAGTTALKDTDEDEDLGGLVSASDEDDDSAWDAAMQDENPGIDVWRKAGSPFDSASPVFSAHDRADVDEEAAVGRMASVGLLGALSAEDAVSSSVVKERFVPEVVSLREDPAFYVRKEVAIALGPLSSHLSEEEAREHLLPLFEAFCEDKIWHVRQAACSSLPALFKKIRGELRRSKAVTLLRSFSSDVSRNVRTAALEIIGELIYLFHEDEGGVPEELVRFFLGEPFDSTAAVPGDEASGDEPTPSPGSGSFLFADFGFGAAMNGSHARKESHWGTDFMQLNDPERPLVVAYNFPAVLLTLGGAAWPRLRALHTELISDGSEKVRQSLAASLHEIAKLIGAEAIENDLLPLFENLMMKDGSTEVRAAALEHVHVILAQVSKPAAVQVLSHLKDMWFQNLADNWRLRESLASQIPQLADFLVLEDEEGSLMSIMQTALSDPISSVRQAGVAAAPSLYHNFAEHDQTVADGVLGMLADMGQSPAYRVRVGFLLAADALVGSRIQRSSFQLIVLPRLLSLVDDPVVDVRMALARVVHSMCQLDELFASPQSRSPELHQLIEGLVRDCSQHVRSRIVDLLDPEDPVLRLEPQSALEGRRNLTLGPADGGPHRPEVSSFSMDYESGDGDQNEAFSMDEDGQGDDEQRYEDRGDDEDGDQEDVFMSEHDMDSDLEMVNIDDAADLEGGTSNPSSGSSSYATPFASFESESEPPHHLLNVGGDSEDDDSFERPDANGPNGASRPLGGFSQKGWLSSPGAEKEAIGSSLLSLTSPERAREAWMDNSPGNERDNQRRDNGHPSLSQGGSDINASPLSHKTGPRRNPSNGAQQTESPSSSGPSDPFLSFVSGELGGGHEGQRR